MNIFVLDEDPVKAAQAMCDKHVVKMVLETAQILCTAFDNAPYKRTHYNHPSCKGARESKENYKGLIRHGYALSDEYTLRYEKTHKSLEVIKGCEKHMNEIEFNMNGLTPFATAMPDKYIVKNDSVKSYRNYYIGDKADIATGKTSPPNWGNQTM